MRGLHALLIAAAALGGACANRSPYTCSSSEQCVLGGEHGLCEPEGFCSFPDGSCEGGHRFEPNAGNGLGGTCSNTLPPDAAVACGAVGQSCCTGEPACVDGTFCQGGTCQQCVTDVTIGHRYVCQTRYDHTVWCSGDNAEGQLGNAMMGMDVLTPTQVSDGTAPITDITSMNAGYDFTCAVRVNGTVWCWGRGSDSQLGTGGTPASSNVPVRVVMQDGMPLTGVVEVDGGYGHTCARDMNGDVWCWGRNGIGQLGNGTQLPATQNFATRVLVASGGAPFTGATKLFSAGDFTCVMKASNQLWCWGADYDGAFGDNQTMPHLVPVMVAQTASASAGIFHLCWVNPDTTVSCAGANYHAQLGNGTGGAFNGTDQKMALPVITEVGGAALMGASMVVAGGPMTCAIMTDKTVKCWGDTFFGQTGTGTGSQVPYDVLARTTDGAKKLANVDRMVARYPRACVHTEQGTWMCWGRGRSGEFGNGLVKDRGIAEPLTGVTCP